MKIDKIKMDGFLLPEIGKVDNIAFITLGQSIKSYFSTYESFRGRLSMIIDSKSSQKARDTKYSKQYIESACEAILHFHHFVELIIKDILQREHDLLAVDAEEKPELLYKLLKGIKIESEEFENLKFLEFRKALDRLRLLISANYIDKEKYKFIFESYDWLQILNKLRNRITHRGVFVLRYESLDYLFGQFLLPFFLKVIELEQYSKLSSIWSFEKINVKLNPIEEIILEISNEKPNFNKIALLKEIGRAAYINPIINIPFLGLSYVKDKIKRFEYFASNILQNENVEDVKKCPVCGVNSLVLFYDIFDSEDENGNVVEYVRFVYEVKCFCCSFHLDYEIKDLDKMNLPIENYWTHNDLKNK